VSSELKYKSRARRKAAQLITERLYHKNNILVRRRRKLEGSKWTTDLNQSTVLKKADSVVVIAGDDKDLKKPRKVLQVIVDKGRVVIEGVNIVT
jgi:hypothetical protein